MPEYLFELYVPAGASGVAGTGAHSVRKAAETAASRGADVRYLRSFYVAADETCFVLIEAASAETAGEVAQMADVSADRVSEVSSDPKDNAGGSEGGVSLSQATAPPSGLAANVPT